MINYVLQLCVTVFVYKCGLLLFGRSEPSWQFFHTHILVLRGYLGRECLLAWYYLMNLSVNLNVNSPGPSLGKARLLLTLLLLLSVTLILLKYPGLPRVYHTVNWSSQSLGSSLIHCVKPCFNLQTANWAFEIWASTSCKQAQCYVSRDVEMMGKGGMEGGKISLFAWGLEYKNRS